MGGSAEGEENHQVLVLGLEQTGKTTFVKKVLETKLSTKEELRLDSTNGFNFVTVNLFNKNFDIWDLGGDRICRKFWPTYYRTLKIDIVIYIIDIKNHETYEETSKELLKLFNEEELKRARFFIIFNCFLKENEQLDDREYKINKENAIKLLNIIGDLPINDRTRRLPRNNSDSGRPYYDIIDIKKNNFNDEILRNPFYMPED